METDIIESVLPCWKSLRSHRTRSQATTSSQKNRPEIEPLLLEKEENLYNNGTASGNSDVNNVAEVAPCNQEEVERSVVTPGPQTKEEAAILEVRRDNEK